MTDYELAYLLSEYNAIISLQLSVFMTVVFALLTAAYFVSNKLTKLTSILVVSIYSLFIFFQIMAINQSFSRLMGLVEIIRETSSLNPDSLIAKILNNSIPPNVFSIAVTGFIFILLATYIASLAFYFNCRAKDESPRV